MNTQKLVEFYFISQAFLVVLYYVPGTLEIFIF